jgi:hypothetical protein
LSFSIQISIFKPRNLVAKKRLEFRFIRNRKVDSYLRLKAEISSELCFMIISLLLRANHAAINRFVAFLSGLVHVTLPNTTISPTTSAWLQGGKYGLIIAADTAGVSKSGHVTDYPSDADTVSLQLPFKDGKIPVHTVLYDGPCLWSEMVGI